MNQDSSRFRTYAYTKRVFLKKTVWWMSQTGRGKEVEREKEGSSTTKRFYFVIRRKKLN